MIYKESKLVLLINKTSMSFLLVKCNHIQTAEFCSLAQRHDFFPTGKEARTLGSC